MKWPWHKHDVDVRLYEKVKGTPEELAGRLAFTAVSYAICEVYCKSCRQELDRRSIEIIGSRDGFERAFGRIIGLWMGRGSTTKPNGDIKEA